MRGNGRFRETAIVNAIVASLRAELPPTWRVDLVPDGGSDGLLTIAPPSGPHVTLAVEAKRSPSSSAQVAAHVAARQSQLPLPLLYVTDYISAPLRDRLAALGISYADLSGWRRIANAEPAIFIVGEGSAQAPRDRASTAIARLSGRGAGRVIRALLEGHPPVGVRELAKASRTSPGTVAKILPTLMAEGVIERDDNGTVTAVRKRRLLERWTTDYGYLTSNGITLDFVAPRGVGTFLATLEERDDVALTGSAAARFYLPPNITPVAPLTRVALYTRDVGSFANEMRLPRTDRAQSNVMITTPKDPLLIDNAAEDSSGRRVVPLSQVLADLVTLPGRYEQEADQLMDLLARRDPTWRDDRWTE